MKKTILVALTSILSILEISGQQVSFQIQAGLSSAIREIITLEKDKVLCVATSDGNLVLWDLSRNKIGNRLNLDAEIYDIVFFPSRQVLAIATPERIFLYDYEWGQLKLLSEYACDNPTALWGEGSVLWVAAEKEVLQLDIKDFYPEALTRTPTNMGAAYTVRKFDDNIFIAGNGGLGVYKIRSGTETGTAALDTASVQIPETDTSALNEEASPAIALVEHNVFNTGWYAHYWDESNRQLLASRESTLMVFSYRDGKLGSHPQSIPLLTEGNITGITRAGSRLLVGTNHGLLFQLSYPLKPGETPQRVEMESGSVTHLATLSGLFVAGDFFGNVSVIDPVTFNLVMEMNDESTPALTGVWLGAKNRMITAHKDANGAQVRIWDLAKASLVTAMRFPAQQVIDVSIQGDTIETQHADLSVYRIIPSAAGYDTVHLQRPVSPYVPGFEIDLPEGDPMLVIEGNRMQLREASRMPGTYQWVDSVSGKKVLYIIPPLVQCESLPPTHMLEVFYRSAGILEYIKTWDILDQDMYFMKACRYTEEQFLKYAETTIIPKEKSRAFFRLIKNPPVSNLRIFDEKTRDTLFTLKQNGLQYLQYHPEQKSWVMFYDSAAFIYSLSEKKLEKINISLPAGMFHYDFNASVLAITSVDKTIIYDRGTAGSTSWLSFGLRDFLVYNQDGYYRTRGRSDRVVGFENGEEKPLSYFDLTYNRPDILLREIAGGNKEEALVFARAFEKRKQKMNGILPVWGTPGHAIMLESVKIPLFNTEGFVSIPSRASAGVRIHSYVNGVLIPTGTSYNTRVELSPGLNKIELQYSNARGDTIYQVQEQYVYTAVPKDQRWHFFGGGINKYKDPALNLQYAVKDIKDMAGAFREHKKEVVIDTRENENLESGGWDAWKLKLSKTAVNDVVVVSLSGHGYLDSLGNFYMASHRSTTDHFQPAASYSQILEMVDAAPARKRIVFLDACHSGLLDDESTNADLPPGVTTKSFIKKNQAAASTLPFRVMQEEFLDLARHKGTIVIAAAAGSEFAMESSPRKNGLFTYVLMQAIFEHKADKNNDRRITTTELREYIGREVEILSGGGQKPTINQDNQGPEWNIIEY